MMIINLFSLSCGTGLVGAELCFYVLDVGSCSNYGGSDGCDKYCKSSRIPYVLGGSCKPVGSGCDCICCLGTSP